METGADDAPAACLLAMPLFVRLVVRAASRGPADVTELLRTTSVVGATGSGGSWTLPRDALDELGLSLATAAIDDAARAFVLGSFGDATMRKRLRVCVQQTQGCVAAVPFFSRTSLHDLCDESPGAGRGPARPRAKPVG